LSAPIHHGRFEQFVIGDPSIGLQDGRQRQLRGWDGRLTLWRIFIDGSQLRLKRGIEEGMALLAQEDEQFGALDALDDSLFGRRQGNRWFPNRWAHGLGSFRRTSTAAPAHTTTCSWNT
jgi:hypothetical protein